jgi:hypothetical protein
MGLTDFAAAPNRSRELGFCKPEQAEKAPESAKRKNEAPCLLF